VYYRCGSKGTEKEDKEVPKVTEMGKMENQKQKRKRGQQKGQGKKVEKAMKENNQRKF
jgi:hypothetical protein